MDTMKITAGNRHRNYDMIVAKAADMDLFVFSKDFYSEKSKDYTGWGVVDYPARVLFNSDLDLFLCLPKHKEACLHWLNGGDVQHNDCEKGWATMENINDPMDADAPIWSKTCRLMTDEQDFRIKPKKVKRVIGVNVKTGQTTSAYEIDKEGNYAEDEVRITKNGVLSDWQFIEIEVEE